MTSPLYAETGTLGRSLLTTVGYTRRECSEYQEQVSWKVDSGKRGVFPGCLRNNSSGTNPAIDA